MASGGSSAAVAWSYQARKASAGPWSAFVGRVAVAGAVAAVGGGRGRPAGGELAAVVDWHARTVDQRCGNMNTYG